MDGAESLGTILIRTIIQIIILIIALCILYFAAYKQIRRFMNKDLQRSDNGLEILDKQKIENARKYKDISQETDRAIKQLENEIDETKAKVKKGEEEEILNSIITKSQNIINKEHENAIKKIRSEYKHLIVEHNKRDAVLEKERGYAEKIIKKLKGKITDN